MNILSIRFLCFCTGILFAYFLVPKRWQWYVLLAANVAFYTSFGVQSLFYILSASVVVYFAAICVDDVNRRIKTDSLTATPEEKKQIRAEGAKKKKALCTTAVVTVFGIWAVIKYSGFAVGSLNSLLSLIGISDGLSLPKFLLPLGMSFYSFVAVSYLVDVYRGKYGPELNFLKLFTFISFFPHIIQGPFSRFNKLGISLFQEHSYSYDRMCLGMRRMLWGFFKKIAIADVLAGPVSVIFGNYAQYPGIYVFVAAFGYAFQIYADFSGYMDIMCGFCKILGIELPENFRRPYFSETVEDFWKRWHMTLGGWFKDYVFYPISTGHLAQQIGRSVRKKYGPKLGKLVPGYFALIFVWSLTGLWHGADWAYLIWGWLNLLLIILELQTKDACDALKTKLHIPSESWWWRGFRMVRTFLIVCLLRMFSYGTGAATAWHMIRNIFTWNYRLLLRPDRWLPVQGGGFLNRIDLLVLMLSIFAMMGADIIQETGLRIKVPMPVRTLGYAFCIVMILYALGAGSNLVGGFMYAQF